jgi:hypothetical protein
VARREPGPVSHENGEIAVSPYIAEAIELREAGMHIGPTIIALQWLARTWNSLRQP